MQEKSKRKNRKRKRNPLWSFDWLTTRLRSFRNCCTSGTSTFKFLLDNQRLTAKMWYKVVISGKHRWGSGIQELIKRSRWETDPKTRKTARTTQGRSHFARFLPPL